MTHRWFAAAVLGLSSALLSPPTRGAGPEDPAVRVVDLHVDLSYQVCYRGRDIRRGSGQLLAAQLEPSGYVGVVLPLYIPHDVAPQGPRREDLEESYRRLLALLPQPYARPGTEPGVRPVRTWLSFEGMAPLAGASAADIAAWVARGVRIFGLVHVHDNVLATSAGSGPAIRRPEFGLTQEGRRIVALVHRVGGIVDVSHLSDPGTDEVIAMARAACVPVVATHSNARALAPHARNLTDAQLRGIAATGGVIGVNFHGPFLVQGRRATIDDVVRHVAYIARVAGVDHVAVGSDFEGGIAAPQGLEDVRGLPRLAARLRAAGLSAKDVDSVLSGNALRILSGDSRMVCGSGKMG